MSCHDVQRVVADYCLFGEQDGLTAPHLEHLSTCRTCCDEAGVDRALVRELRRALAARVEGATPSAGAWQVVLRRAQQEEAAPHAWRRWLGIGTGMPSATPMVARLRTASVLSTMALAVVMANGQNSIPSLPAPSSQVQPQPLEQLERQIVFPSRIEPAAPPKQITSIIPRRQSEARLVTPSPPPASGPRVGAPVAEGLDEDEEPVGEQEVAPPRIVWQLYQPAIDPGTDPVDPAGSSDRAAPTRTAPGEPT